MSSFVESKVTIILPGGGGACLLRSTNVKVAVASLPSVIVKVSPSSAATFGTWAASMLPMFAVLGDCGELETRTK